MPNASRPKCPHCHERFDPDRYNAHHQKYCHQPECRSASKAMSQRKWLGKNPGYFSGPSNTNRVRRWRADNPAHGRDDAVRRRRLRQQRRGGTEIPSPQGTATAPLALSCIAVLHDPIGAGVSSPRGDGPAILLALQDSAFPQHAVIVLLGADSVRELLQEIIGPGFGRLYGRCIRALHRAAVAAMRPSTGGHPSDVIAKEEGGGRAGPDERAEPSAPGAGHEHLRERSGRHATGPKLSAALGDQ